MGPVAVISRRPRALACLGITLAAAATAIALGGCGTSSKQNAHVSGAIVEAAHVSEAAPGFKARIAERFQAGDSSQTVTGTGTGTFDETAHSGSVEIAVKAAGHKLDVGAIYSSEAMYMQLPKLPQSPLAKGKSWIEIELGKVSSALGIKLSALGGSSATASNPAQMLSYLRAASRHVQLVGHEAVGGVPTSHYRATIDYDEYASTLPAAKRAEAKASVAALERLTGTHTQQVEVWIDRQHHVRREQYDFKECLTGVPGSSTIEIRLELYDFGPQPPPSLPAANEVANITKPVAEELEGQHIGCETG